MQAGRAVFYNLLDFLDRDLGAVELHLLNEYETRKVSIMFRTVDMLKLSSLLRIRLLLRGMRVSSGGPQLTTHSAF
jgi:hypothetical protein